MESAATEKSTQVRAERKGTGDPASRQQELGSSGSSEETREQVLVHGLSQKASGVTFLIQVASSKLGSATRPEDCARGLHLGLLESRGKPAPPPPLP